MSKIVVGNASQLQMSMIDDSICGMHIYRGWDVHAAGNAYAHAHERDVHKNNFSAISVLFNVSCRKYFLPIPL